jgi:hypothetical protein
MLGVLLVQELVKAELELLREAFFSWNVFGKMRNYPSKMDKSTFFCV